MYQMFARLRILTDMIVGNNVVDKEGQPRQKENISLEFKSPSQLSVSLREYSKFFENILIINTF